MDKLKLKYIQKSIERDKYNSVKKDIAKRKEIMADLKLYYSPFLGNVDNESLLDSSLS